ncbi:MAG: DNA primase [Erysipelotrichaceae bacterium]|jgi:DNA primase|nr:DNA primase [Erysipelotrichaceae bacterium]
MAVDPDLLEQVKKHADIVKVISSYQALEGKGKDFVGLCPFHDDSHPSMSVSPSRRIFKCFVCGTGGDAVSYVRKRENISLFEAMKKVSDLSGYSDPRLEEKQFVKPVDELKAKRLKCLADLTLYYQYALTSVEGKVGYEYLSNQRHLDDAMIKKYQLGYALKEGKNTIAYLQSKGHSLKTIEEVGIATISNGTYYDKNSGRVIFPLCDKDGNVIAYSARALGESDAKYINTQETVLFHKSNVLYNYHIAKQKAHIDGFVYVLEGFMDVFALARIGIDSAVAIMGTALTEEHIKLLRQLNVEVRLCLDGDVPGQMNAMKASKSLEQAGINFSIVDNQNNPRDPDEILNEDGPNALRSYLNNLISRNDFALNYFLNTNPLKNSQQKRSLVQQFIPILAKMNNVLEYDTYCRKLSTITGYDVESIKKLVGEYRRGGTMTSKKVVEYSPEKRILKKLELAEREVLYQMTGNKNAIIFYENNIDGFFDDTYRQIANYIVEFAKTHDEINVADIIFEIEMNDAPNAEELINELTAIASETLHPDVCDDKLLNSLLESINSEKEKINEQDIINQLLKGKSPHEQARILADYNARKAKKVS